MRDREKKRDRGKEGDSDKVRGRETNKQRKNEKKLECHHRIFSFIFF